MIVFKKMSSNNQKIKIRDAINYTNYHINIKRDFVNFLELNYGSQKHKLFLFGRNESTPKMFLLQLQIPVKYNNQSYDISLLVYFPFNFPNIEPEIYFEKTGNVKINPNCTFYIDKDTLKINYHLFFQWKNSFESFKELVGELYNQFNIAFPIFSLKKGMGMENINEIQGDCYLKKNLCKEVELINPKDANNNINNNFNDIQKRMNDLYLDDNNNTNNVKKNIYGKSMSFDDNNNGKQQNNINNINNINNNLNNSYQIKNNIPIFDEQKSKQAIIKLLKKDLHNKINNAIKPISISYMKIERIKENLYKKLKDLEKVERKEDVIKQTLNSLYQELDFNITEPNNFERPDMSNLDTALIISNKDYYMRLAREKVIEEYILIIKKNYEKGNINFNTAINQIRINSRNIFFLKYKNAHRFGS